VRRHITYRLSYRHLVAMMAERGVNVPHTTILRWVLRYCRSSRSDGRGTRDP
jgi:transposase-like protein